MDKPERVFFIIVLNKVEADFLAGGLFTSCSGNLICGLITVSHMRLPEQETNEPPARRWHMRERRSRNQMRKEPIFPNLVLGDLSAVTIPLLRAACGRCHCVNPTYV